MNPRVSLSRKSLLVPVCLVHGLQLGIMLFAFTAVLLFGGPQYVAAQQSKESGWRNAYVAAEIQNANGAKRS